MSDREAFEKWARDNGIRYQSKYSTGEYYFGDADLAWKAWQAAQAQAQAQAPEPVAVADKGIINWIDGKQFDHEADLYTQPAVNQQLLEAREIKPYMSDYEQGCVDGWNNYRDAIAAAQENNND